MQAARKPSNGITVSYSCPPDEVALMHRLAEENAALVEFDLDTARLSRVVPASRPEFTTVPAIELDPDFFDEDAVDADGSYCIVLSRPKRRAS